MSESTIFGKIVAGEIPVTVLAETARVLAFPDIAPQAPLHFLVIPKVTDFRDVTELAAADPSLLAEIVEVASELAKKHADGDYRLIFNSGENAGQTVFHVHAHVLAGGLKEQTLSDI